MSATHHNFRQQEQAHLIASGTMLAQETDREVHDEQGMVRGPDTLALRQVKDCVQRADWTTDLCRCRFR